MERWRCPLRELESHLGHLFKQKYTRTPNQPPNNKSIIFETGASHLCLHYLHSKRHKIWMWFYEQHSRTTKPFFFKINLILALRFLFWPLWADWIQIIWLKLRNSKFVVAFRLFSHFYTIFIQVKNIFIQELCQCEGKLSIFNMILVETLLLS